MALTQIISGGQTGVDIAALRAAHAAGLTTGGWMPRGWRALDGPHPDYAWKYGMRQHADSGYPARTGQNVRDAEATLRVAVDFDSAGERCTLQKITKHRKPHHDVLIGMEGKLRVPRYEPDAWEADVVTTVAWLIEGAYSVVNVAGNSEKTAPGIEVFAMAFLWDVFVRTVTVVHEKTHEANVAQKEIWKRM